MTALPEPEPEDDEAGDLRERSLVFDLRQLAEDARALALAELAYQKSRAAYAGKGLRGVAILGLLALVLGFFALIALTVGLIAGLTPRLGALGATAAVSVALLAIAMICAVLALLSWKRTSRLLRERSENR